jgi:hypothetical protein
MTLESAKVGKVALSEESRIDFLERQVVLLSVKIDDLRAEVESLKYELKKG